MSNIGTRIKTEKGSSLIEIMVSLSILVVMLTFLVPVFANISRNSAATKDRTVAQNLAVRELELIKSLKYDDVGIDDAASNPRGQVPEEKDIVRSGVSYHILNKIRYIDDPGDGLAEIDANNNPNDYKGATVEVTWTVADVNKKVSASTIITRQSQDLISDGGNIEVTVNGIEKDAEGNPIPIEDATVTLTGPSGTTHIHTDENGKALFATLTPTPDGVEGDYSVAVEKNGYIVQADQEKLLTQVFRRQTSKLVFTLARASSLTVNLEDVDTGLPVEEPSHIIMKYSDKIFDYYSQGSSFNLASVFPDIWEIKAESSSYKTVTPVTIQLEPNGSSTTTIYMKRQEKGTLNLSVKDALNNNPIANANVEITNSVTGDKIITATDSSGILNIELTLGTFDVSVSASGYTGTTTSTTIVTGVNDLNISLDQLITTGSILVNCKRDNGSPRSGVKIRVVRGSSSWEGTTDSDGNVVFSNLTPGNYVVYRYKKGWDNSRNTSVAAGIQSTVNYVY